MEGDIYRIDRVQIRATRIFFGFDKLEYAERLKRFSLTALNDQLLRGLESFHV